MSICIGRKTGINSIKQMLNYKKEFYNYSVIEKGYITKNLYLLKVVDKPISINSLITRI